MDRKMLEQDIIDLLELLTEDELEALDERINQMIADDPTQ